MLMPGTSLARLQQVEAHARDDRGQPAAEVLDALGARTVQAEPFILNRLVRLGERAEHAVGNRPEMSAVPLETLGQPSRPCA
jgi:hypothetical protein